MGHNAKASAVMKLDLVIDQASTKYVDRLYEYRRLPILSSYGLMTIIHICSCLSLICFTASSIASSLNRWVISSSTLSVPSRSHWRTNIVSARELLRVPTIYTRLSARVVDQQSLTHTLQQLTIIAIKGSGSVSMLAPMCTKMPFTASAPKIE